MLDDNLQWLINWYRSQCDGDWEHQYGIKIDTLDNPGWSMQVSIQETELQDKNFQSVNIERANNDWVFCRARNGFFEGYCGISNLPEVIKIFRNWATNEHRE